MKKFNTLIRLALLGFLPFLSSAICFAQAGGHADKTAEKIARLTEEDPHGFVLTITAVLVVFTALVMLATVFTAVGKLMQGLDKKKGQTPQTVAKAKTKKVSGKTPSTGESVAISMALTQELQARSGDVIAAIAMALREELECQHDEESYRLTIRPRPTAWNARSQGMRQYNY